LVRALRASGDAVADRCNGLRAYPELREFADRVVVLDDLEGPIVSTRATHWMHGIPEVVQRALDAKEAKLRDYRARTGLPQWLLLVTAEDSAQPIVPRMLPPSHEYRSSFDRAFVIDGWWPEVVELRLIPS
jgi:Iap family predicted aminopeptidase